MKKVLTIIVGLSLLPLVSSARTSMPIKTVKPVMQTKPIDSSSFAVVPVAKDLAFMENSLSREQKTEVGRVLSNADKNSAINSVLGSLKVYSSSRYADKDANKALLAAGVKAEKENWDSATTANLVAYAKDLALNPNKAENQKKMEEVKENCRL